MSADGWIKYWRKSLENPLFTDITAWHIWQFCLLMANRRGFFSIGRYQLERMTGVKGITAYKALQRLKNAKMVTIKVTGGSNNRFSLISICNWAEYQEGGTTPSNSHSNKPVTIKEQSSNTLQEYRIENKEYINNIYYMEQKLFDELKAKYPTVDIDVEWERCRDYYQSRGRKIKSWPAAFRNWLRAPYEKIKNTKPVARIT